MSPDLRHHPNSANPRAGLTHNPCAPPDRGPAEYTPQSTPGRGPAGVEQMLRDLKRAQVETQREARKRLQRWGLLRLPRKRRTEGER